MGVLFFAKEDGLNPKKVSSTKGGEYHSPCPGCGGEDRFIIWDKSNRYFCRQCRRSGDEVQYGRDFHGLSYVEACKKSGVVPKERSSLMVKSVLDIKERLVFQFEPRVAKMPPLKWRKQASTFIRYCYEQLRNNPFALDLFLKRGLSREIIEKFHLGWNPNPLWLKRSDWGLDQEKKLWIPRGLVIPTYDFSNEEFIKLKIRRSDWQQGDRFPKYVEVSGSMQSPSLYGNSEGKPVVVVESELDAILLQQYAGDLCCSMALGGALKRPDAEVHKVLVRAPVILFSLDVDSAGAIAYRWWSKEYPHMKIWLPPIGKSLGDAHVAGIDLRRWIV